jgi:hypothetical protein
MSYENLREKQRSKKIAIQRTGRRIAFVIYAFLAAGFGMQSGMGGPDEFISWRDPTDVS